MKPWHLVAVLVVGYLIGSYYPLSKLKSTASSVVGG